MKINEIPDRLRPREKLMEKGAATLSNEELLAIFLRIGNRKKNAMELGAELIHAFGGLRGLFNSNQKELLEFNGLGPAKVAQLLAAIELNKRYLEECLMDRHVVEDSKAVFDYLYASMRDLNHEVFKVVSLNCRNQILGVESLFKGSLTQNRIYPREVVRYALKQDAAAIICVHNHPSGSVNPSDADLRVTRNLNVCCQSMGIDFHDHLIIGDNQYFSFKDKGLL